MGKKETRKTSEWSVKATASFEEIIEYLTPRSPLAARRFESQISEKVALLTLFPQHTSRVLDDDSTVHEAVVAYG